MQYFMVPTVKNILFSICILFLYGFIFVLRWFFQRQYFFREISRFCQIQGHFQDLENEFVIFQVFWHMWEPRLFVLSSSSLIFVCTSSKLSKASSTFNPNITILRAQSLYLSGGNS